MGGYKIVLFKLRVLVSARLALAFRRLTDWSNWDTIIKGQKYKEKLKDQDSSYSTGQVILKLEDKAPYYQLGTNWYQLPVFHRHCSWRNLMFVTYSGYPPKKSHVPAVIYKKHI